MAAPKRLRGTSAVAAASEPELSFDTADARIERLERTGQAEEVSLRSKLRAYCADIIDYNNYNLGRLDD